MLLSDRQLSLMQALLRVGVPSELIQIFITRCGTSQEEWEDLINRKLIELVKQRKKDILGRYFLTKEGKKLFKHEKVGRYY